MAALPPAGVSLEAQGFKDYISKLDAIDKKQKDVFDTEFSGTEKSFKEVTKAAKQYQKELDKLAASEKKAANEAKKLAAQEATAAATRRQAAISTANVIVDITKQVGAFVNESARLAAQFDAQQKGLNNLAASFGQSGSAIQAAVLRGAKGAVSGLEAINAANQNLLLGVARTPETMEEVTRLGVTLGRTLGLTATQSIDQFTNALGRQSLLILDNFGISAKQVRAEIERLAQTELGKLPSQLNDAEKQALFVEAALNVARQSVEAIGDEAGKSLAAFDGLNAAAQDLQVTFGEAVRPSAAATAGVLTQAFRSAQQLIAIVSAGAAGVKSLAQGLGLVIGPLERIQRLSKGDIRGGLAPFDVGTFIKGIQNFDEVVGNAETAATDAFKRVASTIAGVSFETDNLTDSFDNQDDKIEESTEALKAYTSTLKQAENLQLSFARAAEDAALKLARANEDIARKQAKAVADLEEKQKKDRDKLLDDQIKALDDFDKDARKQVAKAEGDIRKARKEAGEQRKRDQEKLHRDLARAQERFNLSQLQSERRFELSESRLRAEGDILALKELREDRALERLEEKENFDLSKKEQVQSAAEQQKEQSRDLEKRVKELKSGLEDQRRELLASFDEQLEAQRESQAEATELQQRKFADDKVERDIALAREEEDRRISQRRQLEDLGRSLADQKDVTEEGATAIADELEKVFGIEGTASNIMAGFTAKTTSEFKTLFSDLAEITKQAEEVIPLPITNRSPGGSPGGAFGGRIGGVAEFQHGGIVSGGPIGSPQLVKAHVGETILPTHQQSFTMAAPIIPSQNLNVSMSGGFDIRGGGEAGKAATSAAINEMTESFRIAIDRLARRN